MKQPHKMTVREAAGHIARGALTSEALVTACLARIMAHDDRVRAWEHLDAETALAQARARDREPSRGLLHGIPIAVKDIIDTADMPTAYGSTIYRSHRPVYDAACVALARAAGAVVIGKTVTTEFAGFQPSRTTNPRHHGHTPGGSSAGSAAAVADLMVPAALGTQTAGSIIRPASFCGAVGYKPTFGTISRAGIKPLSDSLDTVGVFARTVDDARILVTELFGGPLPGRREAARMEDQLPRIGFCRTFAWEQAESSLAAALEAAAARLAGAGAEVEDLDLPPSFEGLSRAHGTIMAFEMTRALSFEANRFSGLISPRLTDLLRSGAKLSTEDYAASLALAERCRIEFDRVMERFDAVLTPAAPGEAPRGLATTGDPVFNRDWTLLHAPCVTIPALTGPSSLPIGVQLVGRRRHDDVLLTVAEWVSQRLNEH